MTQEAIPQSRVPSTNGHVETGANVETSSAPNLAETCRELRRRVLEFLEEQADDESTRHTQNQTRVSLEVVEASLKRYKLEELSLSYNGGKDCLVLLVLILACLPTIIPGPPTSTTNDSTTSDIRLRPQEEEAAIQPLQAMYIAPPDPFHEVEEFVVTSTAQYHLDLRRYSLPMRAALNAYLDDRKAVKAIFMGTRRTDPHSEALTHFSPTDKDWPQFMRINPMIDWRYTDIWNFIRRVEVPYCQLYDLGYTSLGGTSNTLPNPVLALENGNFRPAHELVRDEEERLGRDK